MSECFTGATELGTEVTSPAAERQTSKPEDPADDLLRGEFCDWDWLGDEFVKESFIAETTTATASKNETGEPPEKSLLLNGEKNKTPLSDWLTKMCTKPVKTTMIDHQHQQNTIELEEPLRCFYTNGRSSGLRDWLLNADNDEDAMGLEACNFKQYRKAAAFNKKMEEKRVTKLTAAFQGATAREEVFRRQQETRKKPDEPLRRIPSGPYPFEAKTYREFMKIFKEKPKVKEFDIYKIRKCPEQDSENPSKEWICRITNIEAYYLDDQEETLEFEWCDPSFKQQHKSFREKLNYVYSFVKDARQCKLKCEGWSLEDNDEDLIRAAVVDLGQDGFHRCNIDLSEIDFDFDDTVLTVPVHLVDFNKSKTVPVSCLYECLEEFGDHPTLYSDLFLYQFAPIMTMDSFRHHVFKYFKKAGSKMKYKAVVRFKNANDIPIVDLYTLDNPSAYVNDLIAAALIKTLPGHTLPKAPSARCDMLLPHQETTGELGLQMQSCEFEWFRDIAQDVQADDLTLLIQKYKSQNWTPTPLNKETIYCTIFYHNEYCYRVKLLSLEPPDSTTDTSHRCGRPSLLAHFFDYGNYGLVDPDLLIPVDHVLPALGRFKPQLVMARLANVADIDFDRFWAIHHDCALMTIEVLLGGNQSNVLPVVDIINTMHKAGSETRSSEILRNQYYEQFVDFKSTSRPRTGPLDRRPKACDSMQVINLKELCWTRPPQTAVMIEEGVNVRVTVMGGYSPDDFMVETATNTYAWDQMEDELTSWMQQFKYLNKLGFEDNNFNEQQFYCYLEPYSNKYWRVLYAEEFEGEKPTPKPLSGSSMWHRVVPPEPTIDDHPLMQKVYVYAVDHGKVLGVLKYELRTIAARFCRLPPRAMRAGIYNNNVNWTEDEVKAFREIVKGKTYLLRIRNLEFTKGYVPHATGDLYHMEAFDEAYESVIRDAIYDPPGPKFKLTPEELGHFGGRQPGTSQQSTEAKDRGEAGKKVQDPQPQLTQYLNRKEKQVWRRRQ